MEIVNLQRDFEYFSDIWEYKKSGVTHTAQCWDGRAADWGEELKEDSPFRQSLNERVRESAEYLRAQGALTPGCQAIDIGCGPGRFVVEFAKTAEHATGIDISPKMLELGAAHARECGRDNVTFLAEDFGALDIDVLGWEQKFDLVFTSITPAIGTMANLEKLMRICRGYCFNSCFVRWEDELENKIGRELFHRQENSDLNKHGNWFYSLLNLVWIMGYFPVTRYHFQIQEDYEEVDEALASYYAKCFSEDMTSSEEDTSRILAYLKEQANSEGKILRKHERWYGWILWDVRLRMPRLEMEQYDARTRKG